MRLQGLKVGATDVNPRRFVKFSADRTVVQAAADTDHIIGVSPEGPPGVPATLVSGGSNSTVWVGGSGASIDVYGPFELCLLDMAGVVTPATSPWVTSDANGKGVAAATDGTDTIAAMVFETTAANDQAHVLTLQTIPAND